MDGGVRPQSRTHSENLEVQPSPSFRQLLGQDPAASRLLGPDFGVSGNKTASTHVFNDTSYTSDTAVGLSRTGTPVGEQQADHGYESVATTDKPAPDSDTRVYWKGPPVFTLTWELLGIMVSILFLILGALVASLEGKTESTWTKQVIQATRVAPSIWPILFSGVLGNAIRQFANWRVERGIHLLALEQLMSSLTMAGSFIAVFTWSIFQYSSLVLLVLWVFNPLGSQASFRGIYLTDAVGHGTGKISYYDPNITVQVALSSFVDGFGSASANPMIRGLYSATLYDVTSNIQYVDNDNVAFKNTIMNLGGSQAAGVQAATDVWGNVRIPNIEYLDQYDSSHPHEWIQVPWRDRVQNYSSLLGDRFDGLDRGFTGNTTFSITSSYQNFNCSPWLTMNKNQSESWSMNTFGQNFSAFWDTDLSTGKPRTPWEEMKWRRFLGISSSVQGTHRNLSALGHPKFIFAALAGTTVSDDWVHVTDCETGTTYLDVQVSCISKGALGKANCGVDAVRKSIGPTGPSGPGFLEALRYNDTGATAGFNERSARDFLVAFTDLLDGNQVGNAQGSLLERYLIDPMAVLDSGMIFKNPDLGNVDIKLVEKRLSLLYNTLWKAGWSYASTTGGEMQRAFTKSVYVDGKWEFPEVSALTNVTSVTVRPLDPVYALDIPWLVVYFVSVGVMFFAAVASLVLHAKCNAPPVLGYVSSLIRDSVFFSDSGVQGNSSEGGASKAGRLGKMEVKIADVWSEESVGRVAFAPAQGRGMVKKERWYE